MKLKAYGKNDEIVDVDALYFNGYLIGSRGLEGVVVKIQIDPKTSEPTISANWPRGYDRVYWVQTAKDFITQYDVFSTTPDLDNDDGFIEP